MARTIRQGPQGDTLGERETLQEFEDFTLQKNVAPETPRAISSAISSWDAASDFSVPGFDVESVPELTPIMDDDSYPHSRTGGSNSEKKRGGQAALRSELLGENPKESRARIRESLPQGFCICPSGKRYGPSAWRMLCTS